MTLQIVRKVNRQEPSFDKENLKFNIALICLTTKLGDKNLNKLGVSMTRKLDQLGNMNNSLN